MKIIDIEDGDDSLLSSDAFLKFQFCRGSRQFNEIKLQQISCDVSSSLLKQNNDMTDLAPLSIVSFSLAPSVLDGK